MLKSDLLTSEIQKLAMVLARIMGLKLDNPDIRVETLETAIAEHFPFSLAELSSLSLEDLETKLKTSALNPEKVDMLTKFIFQIWTINSDPNLSRLLTNIYDVLESKFNYINFEFMQNKIRLKS